MPPRTFLRVASKFHEPCLLRVKRQTVFCEPLRYDVLHLFRVLPVVETQNGIICESNLVRFAPESGLHHFLEPFVEYVVQVDVGKAWTNRLSLPCPCFAHKKPAFVDDSDLDPLPYQLEHTSIADSLLDHIHELLSHDRVEESHDTLPTTRTFQSMSPSVDVAAWFPSARDSPGIRS